MKEYGDEGFIALLREGRAEAKKDIRKGKMARCWNSGKGKLLKRCYGCGCQMVLAH